MATIATLIVDVLANTASIERQTKQVNATLDSITATAAKVGTALGISFTVGSVIALARDITDFASHMNDLSAQTGIGVEQLQALDYAASGSGVQIDQLADAISQMSKRLATDQASAVPALRDLHLNLSQLMQMSPDQAFLAIATAIAKIPNPMQQSADAIALFGKSGAQLLPLLKDNIADLTEEAIRNGAVVSKELIDKADQLDDAWHRLVIRGKALVADVMIPLAATAPDIARSWAVISNPGGGTGGDRLLSTAELLERAAKTAPQLQMVGEALPKAVPSAEVVHRLQEQSDALLANIKHMDELAKARGRAFGLDNIKDVQITVEAIGGLAGVAKMDADAIKALHTNIEQAIDAAERTGTAVPPVWRDIAAATYDALGALDAYAVKEKQLADQTGQVLGQQLSQLKLTLTPVLVETLDSGISQALMQATPGAVTSGRVLGQTMGQIMGLNMGGNLMAGLNGALKEVGPAIVAALEGGGDRLRSVGSAMGLSFSTHLFGNDKFTGMITKHFGDALGGMVNSILPGIGAIVGPLLSKIGSFFANVFGGPNAQEKAGRSASDAFTQQLAGMLDWMEKIEVHQLVAAGNSEKWATQVVAIRDAYIKAGHSVDDALAMVDRLWKAEKQGGNAVQQVIDEITRSMHDTMPAAAAVTEAAGVAAFDGIADAARNAGDVAAEEARRTAAQWADIQRMYGVNLTGGEGTSEGRNQSDILSGYSADEARRIYETQIAPGSTDQDWDRVHGQYGFAGGSGGFRDFGSGTLAMLHGVEEVRTQPQARADGDLLAEIRAMRAEFRKLPVLLKAAMQQAMA